MRRQTLSPVSYTHLDVYKRQLRKVADGQSERLRCLEIEFPQITLFGTGTDIDRMSLSIVRERYGRHVAVIIFLVRG